MFAARTAVACQRLSRPCSRFTTQLRCKSASTAAAVNAEKTAAVEAATAATTSQKTESVPVVQALVAAAAGIATVSAVAGAIESVTAADVPKYDPYGQRFDQSEFKGRFCKMIMACDPRLLLYTEAQVRAAKAMLDNYQEYPDNDDRTFWEARRMVDSALNEKGEWLPRPFRMSGYVPYNGPICVAMVASTSTMPLLFWSWVNQSQNALVNYYNRNAASNLTNETLMKSYAAAVGSALAVAFGLATFIQKRYEPSKAKLLLRYVAFPSCVAASSLNCYIVRSPEIDVGIPLCNDKGQDVFPGETSNVAAAQGVYLTTASRAALQAPVFFLPPVLLSAVPFIRTYLAKKPMMTVPVSTYLLLVSFGVGLPGTVAIFPQMSTIDASKVEPKFQHLRDPQTNQPYNTFMYNKGL